MPIPSAVDPIGSSPNRALHVLIVVQEGGRDRLLNALIDFTDAEQVRYSMITLARERGPLWEQMRDRGVDTYSLGLKRINLRSVPVAAFRLRRVIRSLDPDVVHCLLFYASLATELALLGMRQPPSLLVRHHNLLLHIQEKRLHVWADSWMARRASKVVAVSEAVRGNPCARGRSQVAREGDPQRP